MYNNIFSASSIETFSCEYIHIQILVNVFSTLLGMENVILCFSYGRIFDGIMSLRHSVKRHFPLDDNLEILQLSNTVI